MYDDEYAGKGGGYVIDPITGQRMPQQDDQAAAPVADDEKHNDEDNEK